MEYFEFERLGKDCSVNYSLCQNLPQIYSTEELGLNLHETVEIEQLNMAIFNNTCIAQDPVAQS